MKKLLTICFLFLTLGASAQSLANPPYLEGNKMFDAGRYQEAVEFYSKSVYIEPTFAQAYNNRGLAKIELNDHQGAMADFNKVLSLDPKNAEAYRNRATMKFRLNDYAAALADYDKASAL